MGSAPTSYDVSHLGDSAIVAGFGPGWAGRLDWNATDWTQFSWTPVAGAPTGTWAASMNFEETLIAVAVPSPPELQFYVNGGSMAFAFSIPLPGASNLYTVVWR